jgi:hypothetical protein
MGEMLSRDWTIKFASALVPRGMEFNTDFIQALMTQLQKAVFEELLAAVKKDKDGSMEGNATEIIAALRVAGAALDTKENSLVCHLSNQVIKKECAIRGIAKRPNMSALFLIISVLILTSPSLNPPLCSKP